ncbi:hypothetical protein SUNI508_00122 [Seiridium unicorne]|uniref:Uncharacterized protein n=1 Tax=Seiridium unicorne TaxID=138068 RepID=A0ABR2VI43_9PEZI
MAAHTSSPSTGMETQDQVDPVLRRDRAIDTSYSGEGCSDVDYADQPWHHYKDATKSYLSVRLSQQDDFLRLVDSNMKRRFQYEIDRIEQAKNNFMMQSEKKALVEDLQSYKQQWKERVVAELPQIRRDREKQLKTTIKSRYRDQLRDWDHKHLTRFEPPKSARGPDARINRGRRPSLLSRARNAARQPRQRSEPPIGEAQVGHPTTGSSKGQIEPYYGFRAGAMYFRRASDGTLVGYKSDDPRYIDNFPNQKLPVKEFLVKSGDNPLTQACPENTVRYFHFPSNNMEWIEQAIARYYEGKDRRPEDGHRLLARENWQGQMHGSGPTGRTPNTQEVMKTLNPAEAPTLNTRRGGPVHSRYMRSKCSLIPREAGPKYHRSVSASILETGPKALKKTGSIALPPKEKNVALFLPYLHWETSSRRAKMLKVINHVMGVESRPSQNRHTFYQTVRDLSNSTNRKAFEETQQKETTPILTRRQVQVQTTQLLGKYLMTLARVAEEMDYEADETLLRENVDRKPPLHIRRTLDQYWYPILDNTSERDRDQVVYRGTISKSLSTRVVMVDQLWLWILDDNTIITSFPRRWGRNKPDPSGVHKSLRERLAPNTEVIKSIHHLALIIVDQCSRVFFDRTKPLDQRPEVMDLFASAIGNVHTRTAYNNFWWHTALDSQNMIPTQNESVRHKYLDINPEGVILKEAQDIAEELMIMKRVYNEQLKVMKDFTRHLTHPHGKHAALTGDAILINKFISELRKVTVPEADDDENETVDLEAQFHEESVHEAHILMELIQARQAEIVDLEEAALRACGQLEGLLSLKQQQASIVEARAALQRADESVKQGRTIQAFTIVTIIFLPLGFFATFFGMNNWKINQAAWMSLSEQLKWMLGGSTIIIFLSVSLAFGSWLRVVLRLMFKVPLALLFEWTNTTEWWKTSMWNHANLERKSTSMLEAVSRRRQEKEAKERKAKLKVGQSTQKDGGRPGSSTSETGDAGTEEKKIRLRRIFGHLDGEANGEAHNSPV